MKTYSVLAELPLTQLNRANNKLKIPNTNVAQEAECTLILGCYGTSMASRKTRNR